MSRLPIVFAALLGLALGLGAVTLPAVAAPKVVATQGTPIAVEVGKGKLVHLDRPATSVFIADPDVADVQVKSPSLIYVFGKGGGDTTLYAVGDNDQVLMNTVVHVTYDIARVQQAIHQMAPRSAVSVSSLDDALVLEGTVFSAAEGDDIRKVVARFLPDPKQLINRVRVDAPSQVMLRVRVLEVSRQIIKDLGFNWDNLFTPGHIAFGLAQGTPVAGAIGSLTGLFTRNTVPGATTLTTTNSVTAAFNKGGADINAVIDALDQNGMITVLAEPNLTAVSGEPASFLAGGEFPIPVPQGLNTISIEFKKFGVSLDFVATISGDNHINMHVKPEVSQLSTAGALNIGGFQIPALTTRRAETTVDMASGQSFAIAGLLENNINQTIAKFPWLGDIPVIGQLFRSETFQRNETELVIIVTPYLVRPVAAANKLLGPTDGFVPSSDRDLLIEGAEHKTQALKRGTPPATRSGSGLIGPIGFDLD